MGLLNNEIPLILFAKTPELGKVKTRLQPECSKEQSLEIAKILLGESIRKAIRCWKGKVILSVWPNQDDDFIQQISQSFPIELATQPNGDLGQKMYAQFQKFGYPAAIMGCDAPHISKAALELCYTELVTGENCIGASEDGGYYIIGLTRACAEIFKDIEWGSDEVFNTTISIANQQLLDLKQLPNLNDVDSWQDVLEVAALLPSLKNYIKQQKLI